MAEIIDLDEIVDESRTVRYKGTEYALREIDTESFTAYLKAISELDQSDATGAISQIVGAVKMAVPDLPEDELRSMGLRKLVALSRAISTAYWSALAPANTEADDDERPTQTKGANDSRRR